MLASAKARKKPPAARRFAPKEYVLVFTGKSSVVGRIVGYRGKAYVVQTQGYVDRDTLVVHESKLRKLTFDRYAQGAEIRVLWGSRLWKAKVVKSDGDFHWITYPGWDKVWDEWVLSNRILPAKPRDPDAAKKIASCGGRYSKLLARLEVKGDLKRYKLFNEEGYFKLKEWGGHKNPPAGYWVYVYPHWYIWKNRK